MVVGSRLEALGSKGPERAPRSMGPESKAARRSSAPRGTCWRGKAEKEEELWKPLGDGGGGGVELELEGGLGSGAGGWSCWWWRGGGGDGLKAVVEEWS